MSSRLTWRTSLPIALVGCSTLTALGPGTAVAGKLDRIRDETSDSRDDDDDAENDNDDEGEGALNLFGALLQLFAESRAPGDTEPSEPPTPGRLTPPSPTPMYLPYPYFRGQKGNLRLIPPFLPPRMEVVTCPAEDPQCAGMEGITDCAAGRCQRVVTPAARRSVFGLRRGRAQLLGEGGYDWDGLYRGTVGLGGQIAGGFGFETRGNLWIEPQPGTNDQLFFWDTSLLIEFPSERMQTYVGAGLRLLFDPSGESYSTGGGFGLLRFELYPARPAVLRFETAVGALNEALTLEGRASLGAQLGRAELYGGYSAFSIGEVVLHGPLLGLRLTL